MDHSIKKTYLISIDALRVLAILAVILVHQTTTTLQVLDHNVGSAPFSLFFNQASRFAVPLLFLISGFVLELNNKSDFSYLTFFKKRAARVLVPYLFWSLVYFAIWQGLSVEKIISADFLFHLVNGTSGYHLYFIPTLIIFYILFPILHKFINVIKNPSFLFSIFIVQIVIAFYNYYFHVIPVQESLRVALLTFSMFIIGMGSVYHQKKIILFTKHYYKVIIISVLLLMTGVFVHVMNLTQKYSTSGYIYNQYGPLNYIYTLLLSSIVAYFYERKDYFRELIITLSKVSFFAFFIHVIILQNIWSLALIHLEKNILTSFFFDPLIFAFISFITFLSGYLVHKIPYVAKITG